MIASDICIAAMHAMKNQYGGKIWGKYGFADAFNPATGWVSADTLGLGCGDDATERGKFAKWECLGVVYEECGGEESYGVDGNSAVKRFAFCRVKSLPDRYARCRITLDVLFFSLFCKIAIHLQGDSPR